MSESSNSPEVCHARRLRVSAAIDASPLQGVLPRFCAKMRKMYELMPDAYVTDELTSIWVSLFTDPDYFLERFAEGKQYGSEGFTREFLEHCEFLPRA